jgi:NAD(P)-dependent dehydrogenase (short-subunit alcohol dehydrogenase family)
MPTDSDLKDLRVAVTGGTSGLGLALVQHLVGRGVCVAFVARDAEAVKRIATETAGYGIVGDIGQKEDIYSIALQITGNLGGLDVLINNASALGPTPLAMLADTECEELEQALMVNGIAARNFERSFQLADHVQVKGASLENGLLHIDLVREIPEAMKPRAIPIASSSKVLEVQPTEREARGTR